MEFLQFEGMHIINLLPFFNKFLKIDSPLHYSTNIYSSKKCGKKNKKPKRKNLRCKIPATKVPL